MLLPLRTRTCGRVGWTHALQLEGIAVSPLQSRHILYTNTGRVCAHILQHWPIAYGRGSDQALIAVGVHGLGHTRMLRDIAVRFVHQAEETR